MSAYMCQLPYPFCIQIDTHAYTTHTYKRHPCFPHRLSTSPLNFWRNSDRICCILGRSMAEMITSRFKLFPMQKQKQQGCYCSLCQQYDEVRAEDTNIMVQHNEVESSVCNLARVFGICFSVLCQFDDYSIRKFLQTQIFFFLWQTIQSHTNTNFQRT